MIYFKLINLLSFIIVNLFATYYLLNIFQQEHYCTKKYLGHFLNFYFKNIYLYFFYICIFLTVFQSCYHTILILLMVIIILIFPKKYIVKLKITRRILFLWITYCIVSLIPFLFFNNHLIIYLILSVLSPCIYILCNLINTPIEMIIRKKYINLAKQKLNNNKNLITIGITGSYGKTSCKNIINHIVQDYYLTLSTPKSYNTLMGITSVINNQLHPNTEILILEMGAFRKGEIKEMTKFVPLNIAGITGIGPQHLSTFKTMSNVLSAKLEIVSSICYESSLVLNGDNQYLKNLDLIQIQDLCFVGLDDSNRYLAKNIEVKDGITEFDIYKREKRLVHITTKLLGKHNIRNILFAYGIIQALNKKGLSITNSIFEEKVKSIEYIPHRLAYSKQGNINIYDDSYSSNLVGFMSAVEVLEKIKTKKVIITPGIVDCGKSSKNINESAAESLIKVFDEIYLIRNKNTKYYTNILEAHSAQYIICKSFKDAISIVREKYKEEEISLLIENDLPDNFLER